MKNNVVKCVFMLLLVTICICALSTTMVSRASENNISEFSSVYSDDTIKQSAVDTTGTAIRAARILQSVLISVQIIAIVIAFALAVIVVATIHLIIKTKQETRKEISEDFTKEQKEEAEKNCRIYTTRIVIIIVLIGMLLFGSMILEIIKRFAVKPIIYIYPEENGTKVSVTVSNPEKLTCTYPKYGEGWEVLADKDGTLTDNTGRKYYSLYWEGKDYKNSNFDEGFVVKGEDTASFLEEKLAILGLNEREAEEFIVYWLPILERNNYNLIRFLTEDEINSQMELNIDPKPDTLIRIMMEYKPLMFNKNVKEQVLEKVERTGYTVVEWGGIKR